MRTLAVLAALVAMIAVHGIALADATPVQLVLTYLPGVSNTGSQAASGIAELVMPEGEVRVSATDLEHLDGDGVYAVWVINTETNEFFRVGQFNARQGTNAVHYEQVLPDAIPNKHWNVMLITLEPDADASHPSDKHAIAGLFPRGEHDPAPMVLP